MAQLALDELRAGPPARVIYRLGLMVYAGLFIVSLVGLIDAVFLARLGPLALAAFAFTLTTNGMLFGFASAFGTGVRTSVGQCLGRGDRDAAASTASAACLASVPLFFGLGALGAAFDSEIFRLCGASELDSARAQSFMLPIWMTAPTMAVGMICASTLHGLGDMKAAFNLILLNLPITLVFAPLMIFGLGPIPPLGLAGAGAASALAWIFSASGGLFLMARRGMLRKVEPRTIKSFLQPVTDVALPASVSHITLILGLGMLTGIVARLGTAATAALAVQMRITDFMLMGANALSVGVQIVASIAIGAGDKERVRALVTTGVGLCFAWGLGCALVLGVAAGPLAAFLARDASVVPLVEQVLRIGSVSFPFFAAIVAAGASLNAVMRPRDSLVLSVVGSFVVMIPVLEVCTRAWGWMGFCVGLVISRVAGLALSAAWLHRVRLLDWAYAGRQLSRSVPAPRA